MAKSNNTTSAPSVKPILFSVEMVRALLDGRKTQTRRVISPHKKFPNDNICRPDMAFFDHQVWFHGEYESVGVMVDAPYSVGDLLWVRETWRGIVQINAPWGPLEEGVARYVPDRRFCKGVEFKASHVDNDEPWQPSIHMPRWVSRLTLRVTNVRAERLQDISETDARAEGVRKAEVRGHTLWSGRGTERPTLPSARQAFLGHIWTDLYGEHETKSVGANPWVWVYEFEVICKNVDEVA